MSKLISVLGTEIGSLLIGLSAFAVFMVAVFYIRGRRTAWLLQLHIKAHNNMSQGLCMFDRDRRLLLCNKRYLEMYDIENQNVHAGTTLGEIIELRYKAGSSPKMSKEHYAKWRDTINTSDQQSETIVELMNGRIAEIRHQPMSDGGYIATHEDITERQLEERRRTIIVEQEKRRSIIEDAIISFRASVDTVLQTVCESLVTLKSTATSLSDSSHQTSLSTACAVHTSNGASAEASAAASAVEELSASIGSISQQLKTTTRLVGTAVLEANVADTEISDLAQSAVKIDDIVKIIREIAEQTNLLALNATIEAARAGEAGKGFAVVASEVKSLAVQTAKATEQIATQISTVKNSAAAAVNAIHRNADRMQDINQHTAAVAKSVEEQNAATGEISFNVANATTGTRAIRETLDEVNLAAIKTQESAQTLLGASRSVETAVNLLQNKVVGFLQKVAV